MRCLFCTAPASTTTPPTPSPFDLLCSLLKVSPGPYRPFPICGHCLDFYIKLEMLQKELERVQEAMDGIKREFWEKIQGSNGVEYEGSIEIVQFVKVFREEVLQANPPSCPPPDEYVLIEDCTEIELTLSPQSSPPHTSFPKKKKSPTQQLYKSNLNCCETKFKSISSLKAHNKLAHGSITPHVCKKCGKRWTIQSGLKRHEEGAHRETTFACSSCGKHLHNHSALKRHMRIHDVTQVNEICEYCKLKFLRKDDLISHTVRRHRDEVGLVKCGKCGEEMDGCVEYVTHLSYHWSGSPPTCCSTSFPSKPSYHLHKHSTHNIPIDQSTCPHCSTELYTKKALKLHTELHQPINTSKPKNLKDRTYRCVDCLTAFSSRFDLKEHRMKEHKAEKKLRCGLCGEEFEMGAHEELNRHKANHEEKLPSKGEKECEICGRVFGSFQSLKRHHITIHLTTKKFFPCTLCPFRTRRKDDLQKHINRHVSTLTTTATIYECSHCSKTFPKEETLVQHLKSHDTTCEICHANFTTHKNLIRHMALHSGKRMFYCVLCGKDFVRRDDVLKHLRVTEGVEENKRGEFVREKGKSVEKKDDNDVVKWDEAREAVVILDELIIESLLCKYCCKYYSNSDALLKHINSHTQFELVDVKDVISIHSE